MVDLLPSVTGYVIIPTNTKRSQEGCQTNLAKIEITKEMTKEGRRQMVSADRESLMSVIRSMAVWYVAGDAPDSPICDKYLVQPLGIVSTKWPLSLLMTMSTRMPSETSSSHLPFWAINVLGLLGLGCENKKKTDNTDITNISLSSPGAVERFSLLRDYQFLFQSPGIPDDNGSSNVQSTNPPDGPGPSSDHYPYQQNPPTWYFRNTIPAVSPGTTHNLLILQYFNCIVIRLVLVHLRFTPMSFLTSASCYDLNLVSWTS